MSEPSHKSVTFDRAADYYDATRAFPPGQEVGAAQALARAGNLGAHSSVLEIGIGTGRVALPLARFVGRVYGVDLSRRMMARLLAKRQDEAIFMAEGDATRLPFAAGRFDAVVAVHVFHLIAGWRDALAETARVLRPGGVVISGAEGRNALSAFWDAVDGKASARARPGVPHEKRETFLEEAGWIPAGVVRHTYTEQRIPQRFIDGLRARIFSSTWEMDDAEIEARAAAVREVALEKFGALDRPIDIEMSFEARAYQPPR
ncbi:MAG: methyltransferase domain-containing protein [Anaerolineae bacterium]|nr:methyltransferase domain-containing protein [Anaerolineae bacterium]